MTTPQVRARSKTVTRRMGWLGARPGQRLTGVEKAMGLKKGQRQVVLCEIEIVSVRRERVDAITADDVAREGFPDWTAAQFVAFFCDGHRCKPSDVCTRIEYRYLDEAAA
jgi:hypothetical protein